MPGLRAANFGDIVVHRPCCCKHRRIFYVLIVVDGATTFVTAFAPSTKASHETIQCLIEWMDTFHCTPKTLCADMAVQLFELHEFYRKVWYPTFLDRTLYTLA